jgi:hypothetical protein
MAGSRGYRQFIRSGKTGDYPRPKWMTMKTLKFKIILSAFTGILLYISHIMVYREITANSDFPFFSAVFFLLFLMLWTGFGILFSPFKKGKKPHFLFPLLCISPATLLSLSAIQLLTSSYPIQNYTSLAIVALTACFPLGTLSGILLVSARNSISPHLQKHVAFFGAMGYFAAGFILYPMNLFNVLVNPHIYTLTCNGLVMIAALMTLKFKRAHSIRYWVLTLATFIIALNFLFLKLENYSAHRTFASRFPTWKLVKTYFTHYGRISAFSQKMDSKYNRFMILKNTKIQQVLPDDCTLYKTTMIPFSLQPNRKELRVLTLGSPFSFIPTMLSSLPYVKDVTAVATGRNTMPLMIQRSFILPPGPKMKLADMNINNYLKDSRKKFDLIIWLSPKQEYLNFDSMLRLCRSRMVKDGVIAIPASLLAVNNAQSSCRKVFKNKISLPGKSLVYAFSNADLSSNLNVLEKRLDKLDTREAKMFPPGTFSIIYSIPRKISSLNISVNKGGVENLLIKSFNSLNINTKNILIIFALSCIYFISRFFILRRKRMYAATGLFENGLCLMLLMLILTTLYAQSEGAFYYSFGTMLAVASGIPAGIGLSRFKLQRLAVVMSIMTIFLSLLSFWEYHHLFIPGIAYINFLCGGIIIANIFKQNPDAGIKLLSIHFLAAALAAGIMFTLLIMHFNLFCGLFIVVLFRIPLIFSQMALGKLDIPGKTTDA